MFNLKGDHPLAVRGCRYPSLAHGRPSLPATGALSWQCTNYQRLRFSRGVPTPSSRLLLTEFSEVSQKFMDLGRITHLESSPIHRLMFSWGSSGIAEAANTSSLAVCTVFRVFADILGSYLPCARSSSHRFRHRRFLRRRLLL